MVRKHGKEPYNIVVLHGGPGAAGSAFGLARLISKEFGVLEPMQSKYTIEELEEELMEQIEESCAGKVILAGHSWGAWLAGLFAERFPDKVEKVILIGSGPLDEYYVPQIGERRKENMSSEEAEEFEKILEIYNRYPMKELIVHPRVQQDFYKNHPNLEVFAEVMKNSKNPVCYNGDLFSYADYKIFTEQFPDADTVMIGRGLLMDPGLTRQIKTGEKLRKEELKAYHDKVYLGYQNVLSGDKTILFKMKEFWGFLAPAFTHYEKYAKKIKKSERLYAYEAAVEALFSEQDLAVDSR